MSNKENKSNDTLAAEVAQLRGIVEGLQAGGVPAEKAKLTDRIRAASTTKKVVVGTVVVVGVAAATAGGVYAYRQYSAKKEALALPEVATASPLSVKADAMRAIAK